MRHVLDWSKQTAVLNDQTMFHPHPMAWRRRQFRSFFLLSACGKQQKLDFI
jgi:hypothetical protein